MDSFKLYQSKADKHIKTAEHLLTVTLPLVKDQKLVLASLENIFLALENSITAILEFEQLYKRIPPFQNNFDSKFNTFRARVVSRLEIDPNYLELIEEVKSIIEAHKKSPFKFAKDEIIISSEGFKFKTLKNDQIMEMIKKTSNFIKQINNIINQNKEEVSKPDRDLEVYEK